MWRRDCTVVNCLRSDGAMLISPTYASMRCAPFICNMFGIARRKHRVSRCQWMSAQPRTYGCGGRPPGIGNPTTRYSRAPYSGKTSGLARCVAAKDPSPGGIAGRDQQENYIARLSTHLLDASDRQQRERESDPGIDAARQQSLDV
jgi:hypothetical protein